MQKIAIKEKISQFEEALSSLDILEIITGLRNNGIQQGEFNKLKDLLIQKIITSKSNYDNLILQDEDLKQISDSIDTDVYLPERMSRLITRISPIQLNQRNNLLSNSDFLDYLIFHQSLINLNNVAKTTIKESQETENVIIFTLVSEEDPIINKIVEVLRILQELIDLVEEIFNEEQSNKIYLLDKGSNTNIGVETGIKTAKSLFQIFKEVWDWMMNRKYYKEKLRNAAFMENMDVIARIAELKEKKALSNEDADRYRERIIKKTDELLSLNTVPRQLLLDQAKDDEERLLLDYNEVRLLKEGKEISDS